MKSTKIFGYYFSKILRRNWLRITTFFVLISGIWWFLLPWALTRLEITLPKRGGEEIVLGKEKSFKDKVKLLSKSNILLRENEKTLEKIKNELIEKMANEQDEIKKKKFATKIFSLQNTIDGKVDNFLPTPFNSVVGSLINGEDLSWQNLNDLNLWVLSGLFINYLLLYPILDKVFIDPLQDGEESLIITFTPSVRRLDIIIGKVLAFLAIFSLIQFLLFVIPFSIYYFWIGSDFSLSNYFLTILYTTLIGPILYSGLVFFPYLFLKLKNKILGSVFSFSVSYFGFFLTIFKLLFAKSWIFILEKNFFTVHWFTLASLLIGLISLILYSMQYENRDISAE